MPRKKARVRPPSENAKSRPVSFRIDRGLLEQLDGVALHLGLSRNSIVSLVLREYIAERGDGEIRRIADKEGTREQQPVNLFA